MPSNLENPNQNSSEDVVENVQPSTELTPEELEALTQQYTVGVEANASPDDHGEVAAETPAEQDGGDEGVEKQDSEGGQEKATEDPLDFMRTMNNKLLDMPERQRAEAVANLTTEEISTIAEGLAEYSQGVDPMELRSMIVSAFNKDERLLSDPKTREAIKNALTSKPSVHLYEIQGFQLLPGIGEVLANDADMQPVYVKSATSFFKNLRAGDDMAGGFEVLDALNLPTEQLHDVAEELKSGKTDTYREFVSHYGPDRLYPNA